MPPAVNQPREEDHPHPAHRASQDRDADEHSTTGVTIDATRVACFNHQARLLYAALQWECPRCARSRERMVRFLVQADLLLNGT